MSAACARPSAEEKAVQRRLRRPPEPAARVQVPFPLSARKDRHLAVDRRRQERLPRSRHESTAAAAARMNKLQKLLLLLLQNMLLILLPLLLLCLVVVVVRLPVRQGAAFLAARFGDGRERGEPPTPAPSAPRKRSG